MRTEVEIYRKQETFSLIKEKVCFCFCLFYFSLLPSKCQCNIQVVQMSNLAHIYQGCSVKELTFSYFLKYKSHIHYNYKYLLVRFW